MVNRNILFCIVVIAILTLSAAGAWAGEMTEDEKETEEEGGVGMMLAASAVAPMMNYQGRLLDSGGNRGGNPVTGKVEMTYNLFVHPQDLVGPVWNDTKNVSVVDGLFNTNLTNLPVGIFNQALWLEIEVDGETLSPRQQLMGAPYAFSLVPGAEMLGSLTRPLLTVNNTNRHGIEGRSYDRDGVRGISYGGGLADHGVYGETDSTSSSDAGVYGKSTSNAAGGRFWSADGYGVYASGSPWAGYFNGGIHANSIEIENDLESEVFKLIRDGQTRVMAANSHEGHGGYMRLYDESSHRTIRLEPDYDGSGGWFSVGRSNTSYGFIVDGNYVGTNDPRVTISGSSGYASFRMDQAGDDSVVLPTNAISDSEILNEPGIAYDTNSNGITLNTAAMTDLVSGSITIPTAGYIAVEGRCYVRLSGTTSSNGAFIQIDETAGGGLISDRYTKVYMSAFPNTGSYRFPAYINNVFYKSSPGQYHFRLEGEKDGVGGSADTWAHAVTMTFYPTSYGTVKAVVADPGDHPEATPVTVYGESETLGDQTMYEIDLRYYELKAKEAQLKAVQAELELKQAQNELERNNKGG